MLGEKCVSLLAEKHEVIATDLAPQFISPEVSSAIVYERLDITHFTAIQRIVAEYQPDVIVNCAAFTDVDGAEIEREKAYAVNVGGLRNLLDSLKGSAVHIIQISTDYVFDGCQGPYREEDLPKPINYYGQTKLDAEQLLGTVGGDFTIIRTNVLFGQSRNRSASFVEWVIRNLSARREIRVVNDQYGNPTWADGLAEVIQKIIERKAVGLYHYGGKDYVNRLEFALLIASVFNLDSTLIHPIATRTLGQKAARPYRAGLVCTKIQKELGLKLYSLQEALNYMKGTSD